MNFWKESELDMKLVVLIVASNQSARRKRAVTQFVCAYVTCRVQGLNIGNGKNDETIGSFRMEVLSERLNINQVLLCSWMFWLHVRLVN